MKKSISFALAAVLALSAFAGVGSEPKSVAAETTSTETDANLEVLKAEVAKHTFLGAEPTKIYTGTLERMANENYPLDCTLDGVPTGHIGYRIDDFDFDGDSELLIIDQDKDHFAELVMYEVEGAQVVEKDRTKLVTDMDPEERFTIILRAACVVLKEILLSLHMLKKGKNISPQKSSMLIVILQMD